MKKYVFLSLALVAVLLVVSCAPPQAAVLSEKVVPAPEEQEVSSGLDDLEDLDTLDKELSEDVTFEDVDALGYGG